MSILRIGCAGVAVLIAAAGCASGAGSSSGPSSAAAPGSQAPQPKRQRDVVTRDEIINSPQRDLDLFQALRSLRPHFLAPVPGVQPGSASSAMSVYVGRIRQNGLESLRGILARNVDEVRFLDPVASQNQFGPQASGGALLIKLHTEMDPH